MTDRSDTGAKLLIGGIRVPVGTPTEEILNKANEKMKRAGIHTSTLHFRLYKKSVDARHRDDVRFECTVLAESDLPISAFPEQKLADAGIRVLTEEPLRIQSGTEPLRGRPIVVGMGPAGLFAALLLARNGYAPILIDRGGSVEERVRDVAVFRDRGILNPESNIQFGAGGAGTFSDGKLMTRINDPRCAYVLRTFAEFGAPEDILTKAKPHVGTDLLRTVISNLLAEIERNGGELHYRCRMDDFCELPDGGVRVSTNCGDLVGGALILAPGHSSRDTYYKLLSKGLSVEAKPISVGVRVEHLRREIDRALYGEFAGHPDLGAAEYALSETRLPRGVYTFCMCPGGEVVAAASEEGGLVVNGMSYHARDLENSNSAVAVSVHTEDVEAKNGSLAAGMIEFQRKIERAAFFAGGGDYAAPVMTMGDFLTGKRGTEPTKVRPSYRGGIVRPADLSAVFPKFVTDGLRAGFGSFGKRLPGFDIPYAVLTAAETRTSAPVRILRDPDALTAFGHDRIYPCGEGAGYAGGITSAAVDGIRSAAALMSRFAVPEKEKS